MITLHKGDDDNNNNINNNNNVNTLSWFIIAAIRMHIQTNCAIWAALQAQHMPSATEEIFKEIPRDFNIRWN